MPILSIIIPVYNAEKTIGRTLDSLNRILSGSLVEVVVVDDGSTDRSIAIVEEKEQELVPLDIIVIRQDNQGAGAARNTGITNSRCEWIFFLDSDDEMTFDPIPYIQKSPEASSLGFSVFYRKDMKPHGRLAPVHVTGQSHLNIFTAKNACAVSSLIFRRECLDSMFDPSFLYLEDWLFWIQNPRIYADMKIFPDIASAIIHSHGGNKTANYILHGAYRQKVAEKVHLEFSSRLTRKQKNNLLIQARIGMLQQGFRIPLGAFLFLPSDPLLYLKLFVYYAWKGRCTGFSLYGDRK